VPKYTIMAAMLGMGSLGFVLGTIANFFDRPHWLEGRPLRTFSLGMVVVSLMTAGGWWLGKWQEGEERRQEAAAVRLKTWREPTFGLVVGYPAAWEDTDEHPIRNGQESILVTAPDRDGTVAAALDVRSPRVGSVVSERRALARDGLRIIGETTMRIFRARVGADPESGRPAPSTLTIDCKRFDWTITSEDRTIRGSTVFVPVDGYWFRVDATAPVDSYERYATLFENVLLSVAWT
jgi:hypothetical protein